MLIDTHATVRDLTDEGAFTEPQAEKIVAAISRADDQVATKEDLEDLRAATKEDIESLKAATQKDIESLKASTKKDLELLRQELKGLVWKAALTGAGLSTSLIAVLLAAFRVLV